MDNHLRQDALIEDALKSQPLAPMPRNITVDVMAHIQKDTRPALITLNDFALSLVIALCIGAVFFAAQNLPPIMLAKIHIQGILLYQDFLVNMRWLIPIIFFGLGAFLAALTIPMLYKMTAERRH